MTRAAIYSIFMALAFVPMVFLLAFGVAGWFSRIWWRVLKEVWRRR